MGKSIMDRSSDLTADCFSSRNTMAGKEKMVMKGKQLELCETSWMFNFCRDIED